MTDEQPRTVRMRATEGGVEKIIEITPEYVGNDGQAHVSHINAKNARTRDKKAERKMKEGES